MKKDSESLYVTTVPSRRVVVFQFGTKLLRVTEAQARAIVRQLSVFLCELPRKAPKPKRRAKK